MCKPSIRIKYFIHTYRDSFFAKVKRSERGQFSVSDTLDSGIERNGIDKRLVLYRVLAFPPSVFSQQSDFHCRIPYWQYSPFSPSVRRPISCPYVRTQSSKWHEPKCQSTRWRRVLVASLELTWITPIYILHASKLDHNLYNIYPIIHIINYIKAYRRGKLRDSI